ncbi:MAG: Delta-aminolevulinic acid dehydratase [Cellulomonadaceae bacterium TMED98]|nr:MAG: Delta-aminolevulinic acid dehydratase [Cellulomonadaceae bacterium TMED98]
MISRQRPRRLRRIESMRELVAETTLSARQLILPVFVKEGLQAPTPVESLPGVFQQSLDSLDGVIDEAISAGLRAVMVFGVPTKTDTTGDEALNPENILHQAVSRIRERAGDDLQIIADVCLDEFLSHGHCGVLDTSGNVDNDSTIELYGQMAVSLAHAGARIVGLSGMMDHQVGVVRDALDRAGRADTTILAYSAKFASSFYGPFRDAVDSSFSGSRAGYQLDVRNRREALREVAHDLDEGADIVMVKPAMTALDIVREVADRSSAPVAAYVVSGEHAMVEAAAAWGMIDREAAIRDAVLSTRRAGADIICTYWALEIASWIRSGRW